MAELERAAEALCERGYAVKLFETKEAAAEYLNQQIDGKTVGMGGSVTVEQMGLYEPLTAHNTVWWHMRSGNLADCLEAAKTQVYVTSANGLAETGEIINIDGYGNRVASTLYGHEKVYFVIGRNKVAPTYDEALWRARNIAGPKNAQRKKMNTPCAVKGDRCYDCKSPDRICWGLVTLWAPMMGMETEVVLINEELGY